jgi:hypothetical protein
MVVVAKPSSLLCGGGFVLASRPDGLLDADWVYRTTAQLMSAYLTNNQRLDLDLIGQCVVPVTTVQAALAKHPGVYVQDVAAAPKAGGGTSSGGGAKP